MSLLSQWTKLLRPATAGTGNSAKKGPKPGVEELEKREVPAMIDFVQGAYSDILDRAPTQRELNQWTSRLRNGFSRETFITSLVGGEEYARLYISNLYEDILDRPGEERGIDFWFKRAKQGMNSEKLRAAFLASPEFYKNNGSNDTAWITAVFQEVLGRAPDTPALNKYKNMLSNGATRFRIAKAIVNSHEANVITVDETFLQLMLREPTTVEKNKWVKEMDKGVSPTILLIKIASTKAYAQRYGLG